MGEVDAYEFLRLRELAAEATPGPWVQVDHHVFPNNSDRSRSSVANTGWGKREMAEPDGAYIAAVSPDVLTSLLDRLEAAEDAAERVWLEGHAAGRDYAGDGWNSDAHDPALDNPYGREDRK